MAQHKLVIAEKPSVAQSLAAVIGATVRKDGYLEGNGWRVSWCVGHLAGLADADSYDPKYAKWRYDDLPILPEHWQMVVGKDKKKQFDILKKLMNAPDVTEVVNACDAGREGELIFRSVYELADCQKPMKRLWISSMEDSAIREGFANLRDNGFNVIVGQRQGKTYEKAVADGWVPGETLFSIEDACQKGTVIMCLLSDAAVMSVWPTMKPYLTAGKALYFSHGFAITWSDRTGVVPPKDIDVIMVAPKGSGTSLRTMFLEGRGLNSSYAIYQDATGKALDRTLALGIGIGSGYLFETTFIREATSDLTGERGSLMGAIQGLLLAQYEVLRENGHTPSEAFNETVEELTQSLMPLFAKNGMDWMYANCSTTAQRGALDWMGPFHDAIKPVVQKLYQSVKSGNEAQISIDSNSKPDYREKLNAELKALRESEMWQTAVTVRKLRPENN